VAHNQPSEYLDELFGMTGQVAVVIGGTGVLCGALSRGLSRAGAKVVVAGRDAERGAACVAEMRTLSAPCCYLPVDVLRRESIQELLDCALREYGQVDMLVNGAGVNSASAYFDTADEDFTRVLDSNLRAVHWGCQIFGRHMASQPQGGAILNIGSVTADRPLSRVFAYSASKAAVINLTQNVARELAPQKVRVNALCPGFFPAEQNRKILDAERTAGIMAGTPMKRYGEPDELIGAALLLLSRRAGSFITGASYYVDGGFTATRF
jgi:NAD(P)-dependent dehydrogenase (short-subunit alcohol dehydrogenase family)